MIWHLEFSLTYILETALQQVLQYTPEAANFLVIAPNWGIAEYAGFQEKGGHSVSEFDLVWVFAVNYTGSLFLSHISLHDIVLVP